jgi:ferric-dicitrate binding protein FerR (iron transport regulator)
VTEFDYCERFDSCEETAQEFEAVTADRARLRQFIEQLARAWEQRARTAFRDAEAQSADPQNMERRAIEHGARIYANCATELREAVGVPMSLSEVSR